MYALVLCIYVASAALLALWNKKKGHGFWLGFWYSIALTPVIGFLTIAIAQKVVVLDSCNVKRRSCPHCYNLTAASVAFCQVCGKHMANQTAKQYLQMAEFFVGLAVTVLLVRLLL